MLVKHIDNNAVLLLRGEPVTIPVGNLLFSSCLTFNSQFVYIALGSADRKMSALNAYTVEESEQMIKLHLDALGFHNYRIFPMEDYANRTVEDKGTEYENGEYWAGQLEKKIKEIGGAGYFITGNPWVQQLMKRYYKIIDPNHLIPTESQSEVHASYVNFLMVSGKEYSHLVPPCIYLFIRKNQIDRRITKMFKDEIIENYKRFSRSLKDEKVKARLY